MLKRNNFLLLSQLLTRVIRYNSWQQLSRYGKLKKSHWPQDNQQRILQHKLDANYLKWNATTAGSSQSKEVTIEHFCFKHKKVTITYSPLEIIRNQSSEQQRISTISCCYPTQLLTRVIRYNSWQQLSRYGKLKKSHWPQDNQQRTLQHKLDASHTITTLKFLIKNLTIKFIILFY